MSRSVDQRVVQMQFDNAQFERNVKQTMGSLDNLKNKLNLEGASNGLKNVQKASDNVDLSGLNSAVENVSTKWSAFEVVAITAIVNLTNKAIEYGAKIANALWKPITEGGKRRALNLERAEFQFKGLGMNVKQAMEDANYAVSDTAYGLDSAAKAASQLGASGVKLGDDMKAALRGISGAAAMTNSSYEEISHIFTRIAGQGRVMGIDLQSFASRGLNVAAVLAKAFNTTEKNIRENAIKKGKIDFRTFAKIMDDTFGEHAKKANETYEGSLANIRSALSRVGAKFYVPFHKNLIGPFNKFRELINVINKGLDPFFGRLSYFMGLASEKTVARLEKYKNKLADMENTTRKWVYGFDNLYVAISRIVEPIKTAFRNIFPEKQFRILYKLGDIFFNLTSKLIMSKEASDRLRRIFEGIFSVIDILIWPLEQAYKIIKGVIGIFKELFEIKLPKLGLLEYAAKAGDAIKTFRDYLRTIDITEQAVENIRIVIYKIRDLLILAADKIKETFDKIKNYIKNSEQIQAALEKVRNIIDFISYKIRSAIDKLRTAFGSFKITDTEPIKKFAQSVETETKSLLERSKLLDLIATVFKAIGERISKGWEFVKAVVGTVFAWLKDLFSKLGEALGTVFSELWEALKNFDFKNAFKTARQIMKIIKAVMGGGILVSIMQFIRSLKKVGDSAKTFVDSVKGVLDGVKGVLDGLRGTFEAYQKKIKAEMLWTIAKSIALLAASLFLLSFVPADRLLNASLAIGALFGELIIAFAVVSKMMKGRDSIKIGGFVLSLATSMLILSFALTKISAIDSKVLWNAVGALVVLMKVMGTLVVLASYSNASTFELGLAFIGMAAALYIISKAVLTIAHLKFHQIGNAVAGFGLILAELVALLWIMPKKRDLISIGFGLILLGTSLWIISQAIKELSILAKEKTLWESLGALGAALLGMFLAIRFLPTDATYRATGLMAVAIALTMLLIPIKVLAKMEWEALKQGLAGLGLMLLSLVLSLNLLPNDLASKTSGLVLLAIALNILLIPIKIFAKMEWDELIRGLVGLTWALVAVSGSAILLGKFAKESTGAALSILILSAGLLVITKVIKELSLIPLWTLAGAIAGLAFIIGVMGGAIILLSEKSDAALKIGAAFALIGVGVAAVGLGLKFLGQSLPLLAKGLVAILKSVKDSLLILLELIKDFLIGLFKTIKEVVPEFVDTILVVLKEIVKSLANNAPEIVKDLAIFIFEVLKVLDEYLPLIVDKLFDVVIMFLYKLADKTPELVKSGAKFIRNLFSSILGEIGPIDVNKIAGLTAFVGIWAGILVALAKVKSYIKDAIASAIGIGLIMAMMISLFYIMESLNLDSVLEDAAGLSLAIVAVTAATYILQNVDPVAALKAVGAFGIFVGGLTAVLVALGAISTIPEVKNLIDGGVEILTQLGNAIGEFVGSIVGGFISKVSESFPKVAEQLSLFMQKLDPFLKGAKGVTSDSMDGIKKLAEVIILLTAANLLEGLSAFLGSSMKISDFGAELALLGPSLIAFATSVSGLNVEDITKAAIAAKILAEFFTTLPREGGIWGTIAGERNLSKFADELVAFGPKLVEYASSVKGLVVEDVEKSAVAANIMSEFYNTLPREGGTWGTIAGERNLSKFADELKEFGPALMIYAESVKGLVIEDIEKSSIAANIMSEFYKTLPRQGGVWQTIIGDRDLSRFSKELEEFGPSLMNYAETVKNLKPYIVMNSALAAMALAKFANEIPDTGGIWGTIAGDKDLSKFGAELEEFGPYFSAYAESIKDVTPSKIEASTAAAKGLAELANILPTTGGLSTIFSSSDIGSFGSSLKEFGEHFYNYYMSVKDVNPTELSYVLAQLRMLVAIAQDIQYLDGGIISRFGNSFKSLGKESVNGFIEAFEDSYTKISKVGSKLLTKIIDGANSEKSSLNSFFKDIVEDMLNSITEKSSKFESKGSFIAFKFQYGLTKGYVDFENPIIKLLTNSITFIAENLVKFYNLGKTLIDKFETGLKYRNASIKINLGSFIFSLVTIIRNYYTDFEKAGKYLAEGFIKGIDSKKPEVKVSAYNMADAALKSVKQAIEARSPSKKSGVLGRFFAIGFIKAILEYRKRAASAGEKLSESALDALKETLLLIPKLLDKDLYTNPVITPIIDLTEVSRGVRQINNQFGRSQALAINSGVNATINASAQNGVKSSDQQYGRGNISFVQNNYSPKPLSRIDIYRSTKNQFSQFERMVTGNA